MRVVRAVVGVLLVGMLAGAGGGSAATGPDLPVPVGARPVPLGVDDLADPEALLRHVVTQLEPSGRSLLRQDEVVVVIGPSSGPTTMAWPMPDVTGDGLQDVLQLDLRAHRYLAREGSTGRLLWSLAASGTYLVAPARLGVKGRAALLGQVFETADDGSLRTGVVALDGATGRRLWTYERRSALVETEAGYAAADIALVGGALRGPGRRADTVVVELLSEAQAVLGAGVAVPVPVDGATGLAGDPGAPVAGEQAAWLHTLPDLDGDRVEDFALTTSGGLAAQVSVRSGASGAVLWDKPVLVPDGAWVWPVPLAGLGGPGRSGLLVVLDGFDAATTTAYDGATGNELWSVDRPVADVLGRADRDGVSDVLVREPGGPNGYRYAGLSGATGRRLWVARFTLDPGGSNFFSIWLGSGGDLDGDGVRDLLASMESGGRHASADQVVVSGRSGRVRAFHALLGQPLDAPLRGRLSALVDLDVAGSRAALVAVDLGGQVWSAPLRVGGVRGLSVAAPARLRPSGTDLLVSTYGTSGGDVLAVDGRTGRVRWRAHVAA